MESSDQVTYDAVTVTAQLRALAGGAAYWTADETTAWVAELLEKYQAHLSRRTLFIDRLKQEVRAHSYVPLIRGCLVRRNQQLGGRSRPRGESCRAHRTRQASCVRGSPHTGPSGRTSPSFERADGYVAHQHNGQQAGRCCVAKKRRGPCVRQATRIGGCLVIKRGALPLY